MKEWRMECSFHGTGQWLWWLCCHIPHHWHWSKLLQPCNSDPVAGLLPVKHQWFDQVILLNSQHSVV
uniref:Uncharacterized protein n=1 Tax=Salix viminalis TaxID=40686 RepID=A0A6N2NKI5_SALVM